ncbi:LacI family kdg operon repressor [Evansella vedderi]|uniref:LacI family kdg operon repressor n=1 Tax=Evansella vedderi TaxID=38282 RepID=A0ABU0A0A3_9BACI|nr:substrate-binding domain-containing protein [Evansella vedderi]MDQ0256921.1 LacI family kdg operon repressor [Evansella vedderi]
MKKVTIQDVAHKAGVSKSTVSQYLNQRFEYMGVETKEKIEIAIKELNYQPNILARSLKQKKTLTVGIIVANILHHYSTQVCRAIEDFFQGHNYHVIICNADDNPEKERKYIEMLRAKQVDGLIIVPTGENRELYKRLVAENYPLVFMDRKVEGININNVILNNRLAVHAAVFHFVEHGHKKIAMITRTPKVSVREERIKGYFEALEHHFLGNDVEFLRTTELENIQHEFARLMELKSPPTALLVGNDLVLMEVLKGVKKGRVAIPKQLSILTFDEVNFAELYDPPISTIAQPAYEMGTKAAELLLDQINGKQMEESRDYLFEGILHIRESIASLK